LKEEVPSKRNEPFRFKKEEPKEEISHKPGNENWEDELEKSFRESGWM